MKKLWIIGICLLVALCLTLPAPALGDDVDYGGGDWGGSDDWGSDWDDDDWDSGGGGSSASWQEVLIFFIVVGVVLYVKSKKRSRTSSSAARPVAPGMRVDAASIQALKQQDPGFSEADVEAKVKNWVMMFENAWCAGDMTPCRPFISDGLYNSYQTQLDMMRRNGEASRSEDLAVMNCVVERWVKDGDKEYLDVYLKEKKRTYKVSLADPAKVIKGDRNRTYHLEYRWQLLRSAGSVSDNAGVRVAECPNCGAQTSINQSGKCDYCGSTLTAESFDWVLNKVDKLSQTSY